MSELEPNDSRNVTLSNERAPGEPPRTGPREGETRGQQQQQQGQWRTDAQGQAQGQSQADSGAAESDWRATERRDAQDHEFAAGGVDGPSLRAEADDGQWSQQPEDLGAAPAGQAQQGEPVDQESDLVLGTELRGPREAMEQRDDARRREQSERGGS